MLCTKWMLKHLKSHWYKHLLYTAKLHIRERVYECENVCVKTEWNISNRAQFSGLCDVCIVHIFQRKNYVYNITDISVFGLVYSTRGTLLLYVWRKCDNKSKYVLTHTMKMLCVPHSTSIMVYWMFLLLLLLLLCWYLCVCVSFLSLFCTWSNVIEYYYLLGCRSKKTNECILILQYIYNSHLKISMHKILESKKI